MRFWIVTLFPGLFSGFKKESLLGKAVDEGKVSIELIDLRQFGIGKHRKVDDKPFGGGCGMLLRPEPVVQAIESIPGHEAAHKVLFCASGRQFNQSKAEVLSRLEDIVLVCGRYEGVDQRVAHFVDEEISIGNYVMMGGETAAMAVIEATTRLLPGVLGNFGSIDVESHTKDRSAEHEQYTKPRAFRGLEVPPELLSGNHKLIEDWRKQSATKKGSNINIEAEQ